MTEETKSNTTKANSTRTKQSKLHQKTQNAKPKQTQTLNLHLKPTLIVKNCYVCVHICANNTAQNSSDNFPSYPPDNYHSSDDVYCRGVSSNNGNYSQNCKKNTHSPHRSSSVQLPRKQELAGSRLPP